MPDQPYCLLCARQCDLNLHVLNKSAHRPLYRLNVLHGKSGLDDQQSVLNRVHIQLKILGHDGIFHTSHATHLVLPLRFLRQKCHQIDQSDHAHLAYHTFSLLTPIRQVINLRGCQTTGLSNYSVTNYLFGI